MSNLRESSRKNWTSNTTIEHINAGSLQRIADAIELFCKDRERLEQDYVNMRRLRDKAVERSEQLAGTNASLRGIITRMKKAQGLTP